MAAATAGGVTSLVCPPDTDPVLDEPGLVEMLKFRARTLNQTHVYPLGALTLGLKGETLTEMNQLTEAGCVGFSQAEAPVQNTQVLLRALQYAQTFGFTVWLRPEDPFLGGGVAASGAVASRLGLSGVSVIAETVRLHTIFELMRSTGARVHLCRLSSAAGLELVRQAKREGLAVTCDVNIHHVSLTDMDIGYFNSQMRFSPPLRSPTTATPSSPHWPTAPSTPCARTTPRSTTTRSCCPLPRHRRRNRPGTAAAADPALGRRAQGPAGPGTGPHHRRARPRDRPEGRHPGHGQRCRHLRIRPETGLEGRPPLHQEPGQELAVARLRDGRQGPHDPGRRASRLRKPRPRMIWLRKTALVLHLLRGW